MPIEPFDFTYSLTSQSVQNETLNALGKNRIKEYEPKSYFFTESTLTAQANSQGAYGPVDENKFNITTQFQLADKKAYAVTSGQVLIVPQTGTGNETKVNIFIKPLKNVDVGVPIKYYVYRGLKKELFVDSNNNIISKNTSNTPFMAKVWTDLINHNKLTEPLPQIPASLFGYTTTETNTNSLDAKFFNTYTSASTDENKVYNLAIVEAGQYFGDFKDDKGGFEIVLNDGFYYQQKSDTGFQFDLTYAKSEKIVLDIADIADKPNVAEKIYRENVQKFLDPAAFYGAHITEKEKGQIKVVDNATKYATKADIYNNIVNKFYNKHKCYIYIQDNKGRSFNFDEALGTEPLKIGVSEVVLPSLYKTDGWPIIINEFEQTHTADENGNKKSINNLSFQLKFKTVNKNASLYNTYGNNSSEAIDGNFLGNKALINEENIAAQKYTNIINYKLTNNYNLGSSSLVTKSIASFIYANLFEKEEENESINNLFGPITIKPIATTVLLDPTGLVEKVKLYKNVLEKKGDITNSYNLSTFYEKNVNNINRLFILKKTDSSDSAQKIELNNLNTVADYRHIQSNEQYSDFVFGSIYNKVIKGVFHDDEKNIYVNSLQLINFENEGNVTSQKMIGLQNEDFNKLIYNNLEENTSNHIPENATNIFFHIDMENVLITDRYKRYKIGVTYETPQIFGNVDISTKYPDPLNEVYIYTVDDHFFYTYNYSLNFKYSEKFTTYNFVNFRPKANYIEGVGFDWMRIGDNGEPSYKDTILTGYEERSWTGFGWNTEFDNSAEAYEALKKEYIHICTGRGITVNYDNDYFVPYLNIYPEMADESPLVLSEINLNAKIRNHFNETEALKFTLEYDQSLFTITHDPFPTSIGNHDIDFNVKCLKEFNVDQIIKVIAYTQGENGFINQNIAGLIKVCKNSKQTDRKTLKIILVKVKTNKFNDPNSSGEVGTFGNSEENVNEIINLQKLLNQNLIYGEIEGPIELDLTNDSLFHIGSEYIDTDGKMHGVVDPFNILDPLNNEINDVKQDYLKLKLYNDKIDNQKYKNYFVIFSFDIIGKGSDGLQIVGNAQAIGKRSVCLYAGRNNVTLSHEVLHGIGLFHSHHTAAIDNPDHKYVFPNANDLSPSNKPKATDNIMSYNKDLRKSTWQWQWKITHNNLISK
ncbi:hypothetical protein [uncultured Flavobacterium sp.]|uniref:hypothetical protein n=1 Tax=uncultured Flavobacterium sp. TaxID=165435 RepID=UPI002930091D|nr:hypothetical protein [uncultured Flavobacterium sp.]